MTRDSVGGAVSVGAAAGFAGSVAMNLVSVVRSQALTGENRLVQQGTRPDVADAQSHFDHRERELATTKVADEALGRAGDLPPEERQTAGAIVHYMYGAAAGAAYGLTTRTLRRSGPELGLLYGLGLWAAGILIALPALRLTRSPKHYTLEEHAFGLIGHLAYGVVLDTAYRRFSRLS